MVTFEIYYIVVAAVFSAQYHSKAMSSQDGNVYQLGTLQPKCVIITRCFPHSPTLSPTFPAILMLHPNII